MFTTFHHICFDTLRRAFHDKTNERVFINIDKVWLKFDFSKSVGGVRAVFNIFWSLRLSVDYGLGVGGSLTAA